MTTPPAPARRPVDVLGIVAVSLAGVVLVPTLLVFLIGLIPEMNAIWWVGIVILPILLLAGAVVAVLAAVGIVVAVRRRGPRATSVVGLVLGILMLSPMLFIWGGSL